MLMNKLNTSGPKIYPCGSPAVMCLKLEIWLKDLTKWNQLLKYGFSRLQENQINSSFLRRITKFTVLKDFEISIMTSIDIDNHYQKILLKLHCCKS